MFPNGQRISNSPSLSAGPAAPLPDTAAIRELLRMMKENLGTLGQTFKTLNEQSATVSTLSPSMEDAATQIHEIRRQIRSEEKKQDLRVKDVKHMIKNGLKHQVSEELRDHIRDTIKSEIAIQVKEQIDIHIAEHLPVSLKQQTEESKKQLVQVRHALVNSEARRANSILRTSNLDDPLAVVLKPDGTRSGVYPADLRSLFSYDMCMTRALLKDHDLTEHEDREKNLSRFMSYIGVPFPLIAVSAAAGMSDNDPPLSPE
ncbi:hypothetical protein B0H21DRAFT_543111 [Amylocystis lapponica]|nr:hypothetical protein B0H21DRAFT_543111 [Amylocystis lapponica]